MELSQFIIAIIAIIVSVLAINIGLIAWFRTESRMDYRSIMALIASIDKEIKDFHGRLCAIEEKYQQFRMDKEG